MTIRRDTRGGRILPKKELNDLGSGWLSTKSLSIIDFPTTIDLVTLNPLLEDSLFPPKARVQIIAVNIKSFVGGCSSVYDWQLLAS